MNYEITSKIFNAEVKLEQVQCLLRLMIDNADNTQDNGGILPAEDTSNLLHIVRDGVDNALDCLNEISEINRDEKQRKIDEKQDNLEK